MKRLLTSLALCTTLALNSCGVLDGTIDKGVLGGKDLITHTTQEIGKLKDELTKDISQLKTETLQEVKTTIEEMMPELIETALNADAVAFLIVSIAGLLGLVVIAALLLLLGAARTAYKRWRHPLGCSAR